jgi:hypothetical protein
VVLICVSPRAYSPLMLVGIETILFTRLIYTYTKTQIHSQNEGLCPVQTPEANLSVA